jgi:hypothetical protein
MEVTILIVIVLLIIIVVLLLLLFVSFPGRSKLPTDGCSSVSLVAHNILLLIT